ncbi:MAG: DUF2339 domain-containing protein, partial [Candidatus Kapaibacterium sp.]
IGTRMALRSMWAGGILLFIIVLAGSELYATIGPILWTPPYPVIYRVELVLAFLALALHASAWIAGGMNEALGKQLEKVLRASFCATVFLLLFHATNHQVEGYAYAGSITATGEFSRRLVITPARFEFLRALWESIVWLCYALLLLWRGRKRNDMVMLYSGLGALAIATALGIVTGIAYEPIASFVAVLNIRALALTAIAVAGILAMRMIRRLDDTTLAAQLTTIIEMAVVLVIFELLTVEINDLFGRMAHDATIAAGGTGADTRLPIFQFLQAMWESIAWMIYSLLLLWRGLRRKDTMVIYTGLVLLTIAMILCAVRGFGYEPIASFVAVLNIRAMTLAAAATAGVIAIAMIRRFDFGGTGVAVALTRVIELAVVLLVFEFLSVELNDFFGRMTHEATIAAGGKSIESQLARFQFLQILWESLALMAFALPLLWRGLRWKDVVATYSGLALLTIATILAVFRGLEYEPIASFVAVLNIRALTLAAAATAGIVTMVMIRRFGFGNTRQAVTLSKVIEIAVILLICEFFSVELNDFFGRMAHEATIAAGDRSIESQLARFQFLQILWESLALMAFALPLLWRGLRWKDMVAMYSGLVLLAIAMILAVFRGLEYEPIASFVAVLNIRALALAAAAVSGLITMRMISRSDETRRLTMLYMIARIAVVMIIFEFLTVETNDLFNHMIQNTAVVSSSGNLENMKQIALSGIWLCYSALLMVVGIARSVKVLRIIAFGLFGLTILKIFIYDLSFLDTLYRIFSFIGLGVILLLISFLYSRYKDLIFGTNPEETATEESGTEGE